MARTPPLHDNSNPLWQGPCGKGWNGGISQSMLVRFLSCRERFRLKYVVGLEPHDKWNHKIGYGNLWHAAEEGFAANGAWDARLTDHMYQMCARYQLQQAEIRKWFNVAAVQFPEYIQFWRDHPDVLGRTPLMQEQVFDVPYTLPSGRVVRLRGKWDSVDLIVNQDGDGGSANGVYLQENKTKGDIEKSQIERQLKFDLQSMMYIIALSSCCHGALLPEHPICGVRYNVVRRPLSGGKGSITQHKATKNKPAETEEEFFERLRRDYIAAEPDYWFFRVRVKVSARDIRVFHDTCFDPLLETVCSWYEAITINRPPPAAPNWRSSPMNYRTPFGVYSALEEDGATEYDAHMETGSEAGLTRVHELFPELKEQ
jgi:hypothetical protein